MQERELTLFMSKLYVFNWKQAFGRYLHYSFQEYNIYIAKKTVKIIPFNSHIKFKFIINSSLLRAADNQLILLVTKVMVSGT